MMFAVLTLLNSCQSDVADNSSIGESSTGKSSTEIGSTTEVDEAEGGVLPTEGADGQSMAPGTYCYSQKTDFFDNQISLTIDESNSVTGAMASKSMGDTEPRFSEFEGQLGEGAVTVSAIYSEGQPTQAGVWWINSGGLDMGPESVLSAEPCRLVKPVFEGLEPLERTAEETSPAAPRESASLPPGTFCYSQETDTTEAKVMLTATADNKVSGSTMSAPRSGGDPFFSAVEGTLEGGVLTLIPADQRVGAWLVNLGGLDAGPESVYVAASCGEVKSAFEGMDSTSTVPPVSEPTRGGASRRTAQVSFDAGKSSTTVSDSLIRGERFVYKLNAQAEQTMQLSIDSPENNAVFEVVSPDGTVLGRELREKSIQLPESGNYEVVVGGTRGNASYDLDIAIN